MIEALAIDPSPRKKKIHFRLDLEDIWDEQKLGVLLHDTERGDQTIHEIVRQEGILLG